MLRYKSVLILALIFYSANTYAEHLSGCKSYNAALNEAAKIRKLTVPQKHCCRSVSKDEFAKLTIESNANKQALSPTRLKHEGTLLQLLSFISDEFNYPACVLADLTKSTLAFYSPDAQCVIVPNWQETSFATLVHEAVHNLQDTHFNLKKIMQNTPIFTDSTLATLAVAEGDAVLVEEEYEAINPSLASEEKLEETKIIQQENSCPIQETLEYLYDFPYTFGKLFVNKAKTRDGIKGINELYKNIPKTTESILYEKKYLAKEKSQKISLVCSKGSKQVYEDLAGEYFFRTWFRESLGSPVALNAARGWQGDKLILCQNAKAQFSAKAKVLFEKESDSTEFIKAFRDLVKTQKTSNSRDITIYLPTPLEVEFSISLN